MWAETCASTRARKRAQTLIQCECFHVSPFQRACWWFQWNSTCHDFRMAKFCMLWSLHASPPYSRTHCGQERQLKKRRINLLTAITQNEIISNHHTTLYDDLVIPQYMLILLYRGRPIFRSSYTTVLMILYSAIPRYITMLLHRRIWWFCYNAVFPRYVIIMLPRYRIRPY